MFKIGLNAIQSSISIKFPISETFYSCSCCCCNNWFPLCPSTAAHMTPHSCHAPWQHFHCSSCLRFSSLCVGTLSCLCLVVSLSFYCLYLFECLIKIQELFGSFEVYSFTFFHFPPPPFLFTFTACMFCFVVYALFAFRNTPKRHANVV